MRMGNTVGRGCVSSYSRYAAYALPHFRRRVSSSLSRRAICLSIRFMPRIAIGAFDAMIRGKRLDIGVEELRRHRLVEIANAQRFPRMPTR
jgi:hypothetical protein